MAGTAQRKGFWAIPGLVGRKVPWDNQTVEAVFLQPNFTPAQTWTKEPSWEQEMQYLDNNVALFFKALLHCQDYYATSSFWDTIRFACTEFALSTTDLEAIEKYFMRCRQDYIISQGEMGLVTGTTELVDKWASTSKQLAAPQAGRPCFRLSNTAQKLKNEWTKLLLTGQLVNLSRWSRGTRQNSVQNIASSPSSGLRLTMRAKEEKYRDHHQGEDYSSSAVALRGKSPEGDAARHSSKAVKDASNVVVVKSEEVDEIEGMVVISTPVRPPQPPPTATTFADCPCGRQHNWKSDQCHHLHYAITGEMTGGKRVPSESNRNATEQRAKDDKWTQVVAKIKRKASIQTSKKDNMNRGGVMVVEGAGRVVELPKISHGDTEEATPLTSHRNKKRKGTALETPVPPKRRVTANIASCDTASHAGQRAFTSDRIDVAQDSCSLNAKVNAMMQVQTTQAGEHSLLKDDYRILKDEQKLLKDENSKLRKLVLDQNPRRILERLELGGKAEELRAALPLFRQQAQNSLGANREGMPVSQADLLAATLVLNQGTANVAQKHWELQANLEATQASVKATQTSVEAMQVRAEDTQASVRAMEARVETLKRTDSKCKAPIEKIRQDLDKVKKKQTTYESSANLSQDIQEASNRSEELEVMAKTQGMQGKRLVEGLEELSHLQREMQITQEDIAQLKNTLAEDAIRQREAMGDIRSQMGLPQPSPQRAANGRGGSGSRGQRSSPRRRGR